MEPSEEIREATLEMARCVMEADSEAWARLWSDRDGVVSVGSDPREWYDAYDEIAAITRATFDVRGEALGQVERCVGFQEGSVGWGTAQVKLRWAERWIEQPFRLTGVFHLERGKWKLIHSHRSFAVTDDTFGFDLTAVLDSVTDAVLQERPSVVQATAPNGTVTILFTDIEGSTRLTETMGDRAWMELLRGHNAVVRREAAAQGGYEVKSQGDGFMLAFPSAGAALRCGFAIQRDLAALSSAAGPLRVRIGVHTGEAIKEADDFFGKTVILASRIAAEARGGEILVSSLVHELVESSAEFDFEGPTQVELRGLAGIHRLYALNWRDGSA